MVITDNYTSRKYIIRKKLHWLFNKFGFKLDIQANLKITDHLDVTFKLDDWTVSPFQKNDRYPLYINLGFNHPKKIFKQIPHSIMIRLATNSSIEDIFTQNKQNYEIALKNCGYKEKLRYKSREDNTNIQNKSNNRKRKILWFTPSYNMAVAIRIGEFFFNITKEFSKDK